MTLLQEGVITLARFLKKRKIPYMVIGGVANMLWGIIRRWGRKLDRQYLDPLVKGLAREWVRPDILSFYLGCFGESQ